MKVFHKIADLQNELFAARKEGKTVGLVPTMGALHEGHASLVSRSVRENDVTVVSVFVNPTQFNDKTDLNTYPRTLEADCRLLEGVGADYVLAPSVEEMYPALTASSVSPFISPSSFRRSVIKRQIPMCTSRYFTPGFDSLRARSWQSSTME